MKDIINKIVEGIRTEMDVAVVGMSGGADSTLVATLCCLALGKENVISVHMPYGEIDLQKFNSNSVNIANKLGIHKEIVPIKDSVNSFVHSLTTSLTNQKQLNEVNAGNVRSRMRMMVLYSVAHEIQGKRARVVGTGNLSEDFIGYDTKGGDALADVFPIGELFKSEVYAMLDYFVKEGVLEDSMIDRVPSAGLWDGQTDEQELGYSYNDMQPVIVDIMKNYDKHVEEQLKFGSVLFKSAIYDFVWKRHWNNKHKHEAPKVIKLK